MRRWRGDSGQATERPEASRGALSAEEMGRAASEETQACEPERPQALIRETGATPSAGLLRPRRQAPSAWPQIRPSANVAGTVLGVKWH